ncbi:Hypothetical predicted protein [Mytilus galloprovincialis]|uniref:C1q domain-containing protein n=1 Tax=Mytilus galloprovincialis TaxID=29158 RepID=A0A8B6BHT0_MYTGA|nr:Hypothetical predicted protein [Mytilus galloprovincialis]
MIGLKQQMHSKTDNTTIIGNAITDLKTQITELTRNNHKMNNTIAVLNHKHLTLQSAFNAQTIELLALQNRSYVLKDQLNRMQSLQSIHQLQDLQNIQSDITTLKSKTDALRSQELARQQDLVAMYNDIKTSKNELDSFQMYTNQSLTDLHINTEASLEKLDQKFNMTLDSRLLQTVSNEGRKVAFTACDATIVGRIIQFTTIKTAVGVNLTSFETTGLFTCEYAGLYHISVSIMSRASDDHFAIYKNENYIVKTYTAMHDLHQLFHMSTGIAGIELNVTDLVHVDTYGELASVFGAYSCLTIIKVH